MAKKITPVIIDTDPGIDDSAAIVWLLSRSDFDVKALTVTHGNIGLDGCTKNALRLLETVGRTDIPVYRGADRPLMRQRINATFAHGMDGMGNISAPDPTSLPAEGHAANRIVEIAKASAQPVTLLAIGPITNIALAILLEPNLKQYVEKIVFMGGAVRVPGNMTPVASFNVLADPEAAHIVYRSQIPVVQIGLDICDRFRFAQSVFEPLKSIPGKAAKLICDMVHFRQEQLREAGTPDEGIALNDVPAAAYLVCSDWFETQQVYGQVETAGGCAGQTVLDFDNRLGQPANVIFAYQVDQDAAIARWASDVQALCKNI